ncbi:hypothetical protein IMY05_C4840000200 [Salix suchowensis]|nr:hypothetical protein IMY05_C4840000200 [Salix suchowensis]
MHRTEVLANYLHENNVSPDLVLMLIYREPLFKKRLGLSTYLLADVRFRHQLLEQTVPEESDFIYTLLSSLKDNNSEQFSALSSDLKPYLQEVAFQRHACQILGQLVSYEDSRPRLLHPPLINGLLSKIKATEAYELRCDALIALAELVKHGKPTSDTNRSGLGNDVSLEELREILQQLQLFSVLAECLREDQWHIQHLSVSVLSQLVSSSEWAANSFLDHMLTIHRRRQPYTNIPLLNVLSEATPDDLMTVWPSVTSSYLLWSEKCSVLTKLRRFALQYFGPRHLYRLAAKKLQQVSPHQNDGRESDSCILLPGYDRLKLLPAAYVTTLLSADTYERMLEQSFTSSLFEAIQQTSFYALSALQVITFMVPHGENIRFGVLV